MSSPTTKSMLYGVVNDRSANIQLQLYNLEGGIDHLNSALDLFSNSLSVLTFENYPLEYGITKSNIALVYHKLALLENFANNTKAAIAAFREAMRVYTLESYPIQYAGICNNLGNVYMDIGSIYYQTQGNTAIENWLLAIDSYSNSLKGFNKTHPEIRASILITRGTLYQNLAMMDKNIKQNSQMALNDFYESEKIYNRKNFTNKYAIIMYNIGVTYMKLYTVDPNEKIYHSSVSAFKEAIEIFDKNSKGYYDSQFNLGNVYLDRTDYTADDCKNAIEAYMISLEWHRDKPFSFDYAMTWYSIGIAYSKLMHLENKEENHRKMVEAFSNSMIVITDRNYPEIYRNIQNIMRDNRL